MAMSTPSLIAANSLLASSMGEERSASLKSSTSPPACSIPLRTLYPLPRFPGFSSNRRLGCFKTPETGVRDTACETGRSEEHTSELQSLAYLVCRLLLEKKKQTNTERRD